MLVSVTIPVRGSPHDAGQDLLKLLSEVFVEPCIEKRVIASGGDGHGMCEEEEEVEVDTEIVEIVHYIDQVERKPANAEDGDHRDQHSVRALLLLSIRLLSACAFAARFRFRPLIQPAGYL